MKSREPKTDNNPTLMQSKLWERGLEREKERHKYRERDKKDLEQRVSLLNYETI